MNDLDAVPSHAQRDDPRAAVDQRLQLARPWQRLDEVVAADQTARGLVPVCVLLRMAADGVWQSGPAPAGAGFAGPSSGRRPWISTWRSSGASARPRNR